MTTVANPTQITILGSGTCVPSLVRSSCSLLLQTGDAKVLFDSGTGTIHRLLESGVTIFDITHIIYSHFHPDHISELVSLLFATKYPSAAQRKVPLTICAGPGFNKFYSGLKSAFGHWITLPPAQLNVYELDNQGADSLAFDDFSLKSMPVDHNPESLAYRITDHRGGTLVYSGDTDVCENLVVLAQDADVMICEAALPDALKTKGHLTPSTAGEMAARAHVKQLVLTHFYPECEQEDIETQCRKTWQGPLILARDLMTIELKKI